MLLSTVGRWLQKAGEHRAQASDRTRRQTLDRDVYRELVELMGQSGSAKMLAQFNEPFGSAGSRPDGPRSPGTCEASAQTRLRRRHARLRLSALCSELERVCLEDGDVAEILRRVGLARQEVMSEISMLRQAA